MPGTKEAQDSPFDAIRRSEANFRALIERLPSGVFVHRDMRIVYVNPALLALLGYERPSELLGRSPLDIADPDNTELIRQRIKRVESGLQNPPLEQRFLKRDGSTVAVEVEGLRLEFDGKPATVVLARDLTERKEMLARLAAADRMAAVGTLAAGVAHEINNPLAFVMANLNVLAEELPALLELDDSKRAHLTPDEVAALLQDARDGAARVQAVVRDLRTLSRGDDDRIGSIDVRRVLESSIKLARHEFRRRAQLVEDYGVVPPVAGSEQRVGQLFLNLLVNAAQAIAPGNPERNEVRVVVRPKGERVEVAIHDTGAGIAPEHQGRIFEPFFTTKPLGEGIGLGLSICHGIVSSLGGTIGVESMPGKGSVFRVELPVAATEATPASNGAPSSQARRGRVLVVDDEPSMGTSLRILLSAEHEVVPLTRAKEAIERIERGERFDAILCDLMMPEMNGMELYEAIRAVAPEQAGRMVFSTGGAFTEEAEQFLERVRVPCLDKPFNVAELRAALQRVLRYPAAP